jgi:transposase
MNTDQKKDGREYASDLNDKEWELIQHFFDTTGKWGRPPRICCRKILNAIFYQLRTSCQWQMLPTNLPHHPHMFPKAEREWIYSTHFAPNEYRNERVSMEIVRIKSVDSR